MAELHAARAGAAMSAARLYAEQEAITDILICALLPPKLRQFEGVDFAGGYRPLRQLHHGRLAELQQRIEAPGACPPGRP